MSSLFNELKRRNVIKASAGYTLLGWLVLQIADVIVPAMKLPDWTMSFLLLVGLLGFPFVIFFSWVYEITPEGVKRTEEVDLNQSITHQTGKKLEYAIIAGLVLAVLILWFKPARHPSDSMPEQQVAETASQSTATQQSGGPSEPTIPSIAVLPFADFSPDKDQEYFSSGISEEILNLLAKTDNLRVAARTSSFAFRGDNRDIREIGKKLSVDTVLEGSIRKAENKIRVTAQLINVSDGYHIWSETYDRELKDIFAIQDEISASILESLKMHLLGEGESKSVADSLTETKVVTTKIDNLEAYEKVLRANELLYTARKKSVNEAIELYKQAISLEPSYVDAKIRLIQASLMSEWYIGNSEKQLEVSKRNDALVNRYMTSLRITQDDNAEFHGVMGFYHLERHEYDLASEHLNRAIELNPNYAKAYTNRAELHYENSDYLAMLADREKAYELDPMSIEIARSLAYDYRSFWRPEDAKKIIDGMFELYPGHPAAYNARVSNLTAHGHYAEAVKVLEEAVKVNPDVKYFKGWLAWGYVYLNKREKAKALERDWVNFELARRDGDYDESVKLLNAALETTDDKADWIEPAMDLYLEMGNIDQLKVTLEQRLKLFEDRNIPWQKRCMPYTMAAMNMTGMNDGVSSMMDKCRESTEERLKAGYLCPCSWFNLVSFAILDERYDDAVKRADEWLTNGDSHHRLQYDALFTRLSDRPEYPELLARNTEQLERQSTIYDELSAVESSEAPPSE